MENNLQNVIDNLFIALNYKKDIKEFRLLLAEFTSIEVLGCQAKYKDIISNNLKIEDNKIVIK